MKLPSKNWISNWINLFFDTFRVVTPLTYALVSSKVATTCAQAKEPTAYFSSACFKNPKAMIFLPSQEIWRLQNLLDYLKSHHNLIVTGTPSIHNKSSLIRDTSWQVCIVIWFCVEFFRSVLLVLTPHYVQDQLEPLHSQVEDLPSTSSSLKLTITSYLLVTHHSSAIDLHPLSLEPVWLLVKYHQTAVLQVI